MVVACSGWRRPRFCLFFRGGGLDLAVVGRGWAGWGLLLVACELALFWY